MSKLLPTVTPDENDVLAKLRKNPEQFAFFQSVWLLQKHLGPRSDVGTGLRVGEELLRFSVNNSMAFPRSDIAGLTKQGENVRQEPRYNLQTHFLGLHGSTSPLPGYYNETSCQNDPEENARRDFLDYFHHRSISMLYRSWKKYRYYLNYQNDATDDWSRRIFAYVGLASNDLRHQSELPWHRMLSYAGLLATRGRSAAVLRGVVAHCFQPKDVQIEQRVERRVKLPQNQLISLGKANHQLGHTAHLGATVLDRAGKFRIAITPHDFEHFRSFLPGASNYRLLRDLIETVLRDQLAYDLKLMLAPGEKPKISLGKKHHSELGGTTWLGKQGQTEEHITIAGRA